MISIIAALGTNYAIGNGNKLLWSIPEDMKRFKRLTTGHPVIMGRKTWESIPEKFRPLPGRTNIVVTRQGGFAAPGAIVTHTLEEAITVGAAASGGDEVFVIGGGELYAQALPRADRLYLTLVDDAPEGDTLFPKYDQTFTRIVAREAHEDNTPPYTFIELER